MTIDIRKHYFADYANLGEVESLDGFHVGEIIRDWHGETGCILTISRTGEVRTDSNGMGDISQLGKVRSLKTIEAYLRELHKADMHFIRQNHGFELSLIGKP